MKCEQLEKDDPAVSAEEARALLREVFDAPVVGIGAAERPVLSAEAVAYAYPAAEEPVFRGIDVQATAGSMLAILGNNGAGKSTLLNVLAGIVRPSEGSVRVDGRDVASLSRRDVARRIALVAQQQRIPHLSVYDQVLLGRRPHVSWSLSDRDRRVVSTMIERLGLERFAARYLDELSGGERQKVFIARALAQEPKVLLLDEPTSALDPKNQLEVLRIVRDVTVSEGIASVLVIHDINLALRFCDRFLLVRDGCVVAYGGREAVTDEALSATYDVGFKVDAVGDVPVAVPLG
ncbi:ABC transporter ATP-binding protein [Paraeggerthella hongkongensis]|uniref:ABC transporter ATP-binding protein n=1 Tax=Paraeggerthella hongkongensis TaxID=230658 RepID=A0A3N0BH09_9ACTN|nr:ABC transporter ATP-binding protein [Paraeggerthella hongkongensis]RNL46858.1 ABC transporter ATP-binding protein [Paraeggerthella hongkongensis]